ncbi:hypothetical protein AVEN_126096-1 [Araneus ventricosus]|uniref:Uncharacterized protein n=1 Tax=Araneus ventricosus TaxID=182803 RepID=A0A4Y2CLZ4_ARAVE|nr:hypothetical protein AVEN_126096-1 [Araneus ventricosus]
MILLVLKKLYMEFQIEPQFQLHKIRVERRHHLQNVCLHDVVSVGQTDENRLGISLVGQCYSIHITARLGPKRFSSHDDNGDEMMKTFNTKSYCG